MGGCGVLTRAGCWRWSCVNSSRQNWKSMPWQSSTPKCTPTITTMWRSGRNGAIGKSSSGMPPAYIPWNHPISIASLIATTAWMALLTLRRESFINTARRICWPSCPGPSTTRRPGATVGSDLSARSWRETRSERFIFRRLWGMPCRGTPTRNAFSSCMVPPPGTARGRQWKRTWRWWATMAGPSPPTPFLKRSMLTAAAPLRMLPAWPEPGLSTSQNRTEKLLSAPHLSNLGPEMTPFPPVFSMKAALSSAPSLAFL